MKKVLVIGSGGSGKSTFSKALAKKTNLPLYHMDRIYWKPNWIETPFIEFKEEVAKIMKEPEWILDGNYGETLDMRLEKADTVFFLDIRTDVCVKSALRRYEENKGKTRDDMGSGCIEQIDDEFIDWIRNFKKKNRPKLLEKIKKHSSLDVHIFKTRKEAYNYINSLK